MRAAFFQREARAVTVGELGMIQRTAEFSMNTNRIPNPTVNKHCARYEWVRRKEDWDRVIEEERCLYSKEITDWLLMKKRRHKIYLRVQPSDITGVYIILVYIINTDPG